MKVYYGRGKPDFGPGVQVDMDGDELASAVDLWLWANEVEVHGPRTVLVNGELPRSCGVYVDPTGRVVHEGRTLSGRGPE